MRLLGKEICVINGVDKFSKEQIEEILQHSTNIIQNPTNTTFCVIVGNNKSKKYFFMLRANMQLKFKSEGDSIQSIILINIIILK